MTDDLRAALEHRDANDAYFGSPEFDDEREELLRELDEREPLAVPAFAQGRADNGAVDETRAPSRSSSSDDGEPPHAATKDPRPDPRTHPDYWTE